MHVNGVLRLPPVDEPITVGRVRVSVRDVTEADAPAPVVSEVEFTGVEILTTGTEIPFELDVDLDPRRSYAVRAHADRNSSGQVEPGDFVSTTAHIVGPTRAAGLVVPLQRVGA
jgi:uncharacterized lipoprotein YbaY